VYARVEAALAHLPIKIAYNPHFMAGQGSSL